MGVLESIHDFFSGLGSGPTPTATPNNPLGGGSIAPDGSYVPPQAIPGATPNPAQAPVVQSTTGAPRQPEAPASSGPSAPPDREHSDPAPAPQVQNATRVDPNAQPGIRPEAFDSLLKAKIEPNLLNSYYSPTYHFRLFMVNDKDIIEQAGNPGSVSALMGALSGKSVRQVTLAESGVTGYSIKSVEIDTVPAQNGATQDQKGVKVVMTIVEPVGASFLDGFFGAAATLGIQDVSKVFYYLELTFLGYNPDGTSTQRPIKLPYANGGRWIWELQSTKIDTKINEGGGTYTLEFVVPETDTLLTETKKLTQGTQTISVSGATLGELFDNFATEVTKAWNQQYSTDPSKKLRVYKIFTHPVQSGRNVGLDVKNFHTKPQQSEQSSSRMFGFDSSGKMTAQVPPGTPINTFIRGAIEATEEGQKLMKDEPIQGNVSQSSTQVNDQRTRQPTLLSMEVDTKRIDFDPATGNYCYEYDIHVMPHLAPSVVLDQVQVTNARDPEVQRQMITNLLNNGMIRKRYDYIYTGKNTEVIDFNIAWNMSWQPIVAKLAGARLGYNNVSANARLNPNNKNDTAQATPELTINPQPLGASTPSSSSSSSSTTASADSGPNNLTPQPTPAPTGAIDRANLNFAFDEAQRAGFDAISRANLNFAFDQAVRSGAITSASQIPSLPTNLVGGAAAQIPLNQITNLSNLLVGSGQQALSQITNLSNQLTGALRTISNPSAILQQMISGRNTANNVGNAVAQAAQPRISNTSGTTPQEASSNLYVEDLLDRVNQNDTTATSGRSRVPISFWQGYHVPEWLAGQGFSGPWGRDQSVVGAIFAQIYENQITGAFQKLDPLVIRGDPFWLGQTNLERQVLYRNNLIKFDADALPDWVTHKKIVYLYFRYPLQIGDNFQPVLKSTSSFNGLYEIVQTKHIFADGEFKTELKGNLLVLYNIAAANGSSNVIAGGNGSSPQLANAGGGGGNSGVTPGPGPGFTLNPTNLPNSTAQPTSIQAADQTTIGNLSASQFAFYKAAVGQNESGNNPSQGNNGVGYVGQYQMGQAALTQLGFLQAGVGSESDPMSWQWTGQSGITSLSDFLANPNVQNSAMDTYTQANYNTLVQQGAITSSTSPQTVAGLLAAAHLAGGTGASRWALSSGAYNPSDKFGTTSGKMYNLGFNSARLATASN